MNKRELILTEDGFNTLKKEYDNLVNVVRPKIVNEIRVTRAMGDLSENGGYQAAREDQRNTERRIAELEDILKTATVQKKSTSSKIGVGAKITLKDASDGFEVTYELVGAPEADPAKNRISYESPIGRSLVSKKVGDTVSVDTPGGELKYKILKVE